MLVGLTGMWRGVMDEAQEEGDLLTMVFVATVGKEDLNRLDSVDILFHAA